MEQLDSRIKKDCAMCGGLISVSNPIKHYAERGNYCMDCNVKCDTLAKSWTRREETFKVLGLEDVMDLDSYRDGKQRIFIKHK